MSREDPSSVKTWSHLSTFLASDTNGRWPPEPRPQLSLLQPLSQCSGLSLSSSRPMPDVLSQGSKELGGEVSQELCFTSLSPKGEGRGPGPLHLAWNPHRVLGWVWLAVNRAPCSSGLDPGLLSVQPNAEQMLSRLKCPKFSNFQRAVWAHLCAWCLGPLGVPVRFLVWPSRRAQERAITQCLQRLSGAYFKLSSNVRAP